MRHRWAVAAHREKEPCFFSSPDNQNGQLYWGLRALGFSIGVYDAPYKWRVMRDGVTVEYTEGDCISIGTYQI